MNPIKFNEEEFTQVFIHTDGNLCIQSVNYTGETSEVFMNSKSRASNIANAILTLAEKATFAGEEED